MTRGFSAAILAAHFAILAGLTSPGLTGGGSTGGASLAGTNTWTGQQSFTTSALLATAGAHVSGDVASFTTAANGVLLGTHTAIAGLWMSGNAQAPTLNNYHLLSTGGLHLNTESGSTMSFKVNNATIMKMDATGLYLGTTGTPIADSYAASASLDFAGVTDGCEDSADITVTGAAVNDVCVPGPPAALPSTGSWVECRVTAADTVKVRHCAHGASGNPAAATYTVRVFDP